MIGQTLGHYEILEKLGEGGMGVVYLAKDLTLDRKVALKILPAELAHSPERLERFQREAKTLAALDHPNIVTIHSVEEDSGVHFLTMQLVEGKRLSELIPKGGMPLERIFDISVPLADALAAAHERGVIHRDLKPGNVMVTREGRVKVLDFGLAKLSQLPDDPVATELPTEPLTAEGRIVGTMPYMSPEQVEGKIVDSRSDIFSLGAILHEISTGERPFRGDTSASLISAILKDSPPEVDTLRAEFPHHLGRIVRRCLEKNPQRRYQSAFDVRNELQDLLGETSDPTRKGQRAESQRTASHGVLWSAKTLLLAGLLLIVLLGSFLTLKMMTRVSNEAPIGETDELLLADFSNRTGDPVFDGTLYQALAVKLGESPFLSITPRSKIQDSLAFMGRDPMNAVTPEIGREVCIRQGIKAMVTGEITELGDSYVITLAALNCQDASSLSRQLVDVHGKEHVLSGLGDAAMRMRRDLGESLSSIERFDAPIEQATTASLEALKNMSLAQDARDEGRPTDSIPLFERALEIDPDFALAHARLGTVFSNLGEWEKATYHKSRAFELRDRASERERFYITQHYFATVTGEIPRAIDSLRAYKRTYPKDWVPPNNLSSEYSAMGRYEEAIEEGEVAVRLNPDHPLPHLNLAVAQMRAGNITSAKDVLEAAFEKGIHSGFLLRESFNLAFLEGNHAEMDEVLGSIAGDPEESAVLNLQAGSFALQGRLAEAERFTNRAVDIAVRRGLSERPARYLADLAVWSSGFGRFERATQLAQDALNRSSNRNSMTSAAFVFASSGMMERAQELIQELSARYPTHTYIQSIWIPVADAALALHQQNPQAALDSLESATTYERSTLLVPYLRGCALRALDRSSEALLEFQKIADLQGVDPTSPIHTLVWLEMGRVQIAENDLEAGQQSYQRFFESVRGADEGLPIIDAAKAEIDAISSRGT